MKKSDDLHRLMWDTCQAMIKDGWDQFDADREEASFESVCFVAINSISRYELAHLSPKAAGQISMFVKYLMAFDRRRKAKANDGAVAERDQLNAYFCASSLYTCAMVLSNGGIWLGVDEEVHDGRGSGDSALDDWITDSYYFYEMAEDVGLSDIVRAQGAAPLSK